MAGIHRSSTLEIQRGHHGLTLGMAGIHRSSTLALLLLFALLRLGMAGIHRSSTLAILFAGTNDVARDGRDSPLKYTTRNATLSFDPARDGRDSPLKYTGAFAVVCSG